jgi:hypothetical protein
MLSQSNLPMPNQSNLLSKLMPMAGLLPKPLMQ